MKIYCERLLTKLGTNQRVNASGVYLDCKGIKYQVRWKEGTQQLNGTITLDFIDGQGDYQFDIDGIQFQVILTGSGVPGAPELKPTYYFNGLNESIFGNFDSVTDVSGIAFKKFNWIYDVATKYLINVGFIGFGVSTSTGILNASQLCNQADIVFAVGVWMSPQLVGSLGDGGATVIDRRVNDILAGELYPYLTRYKDSSGHPSPPIEINPARRSQLRLEQN